VRRRETRSETDSYLIKACDVYAKKYGEDWLDKFINGNIQVYPSLCVNRCDVCYYNIVPNHCISTIRATGLSPNDGIWELCNNLHARWKNKMDKIDAILSERNP